MCSLLLVMILWGSVPLTFPSSLTKVSPRIFTLEFLAFFRFAFSEYARVPSYNRLILPSLRWSTWGGYLRPGISSSRCDASGRLYEQQQKLGWVMVVLLRFINFNEHQISNLVPLVGYQVYTGAGGTTVVESLRVCRSQYESVMRYDRVRRFDEVGGLLDSARATLGAEGQKRGVYKGKGGVISVEQWRCGIIPATQRRS